MHPRQPATKVKAIEPQSDANRGDDRSTSFDAVVGEEQGAVDRQVSRRLKFVQPTLRKGRRVPLDAADDSESSSGAADDEASWYQPSSSFVRG